MKTRMLLPMTSLSIALIVSAMAQIPAERKYDPNKVVLRALENSLQTKYGHAYKVSFHILDSLIANSLPDEITDPYGTLKGCVLFSASSSWESEDSIITGIYKNGEIIWDDFPGSKSGFGGALITTKDINNDGQVDILEAELDHSRLTKMSSISYLWILSWNGTTGRIINDIDPTTQQSVLVSVDEMYDLVDINRDGIMEIKGTITDVWQDDFPNLSPPTLPSITYSWNGTKYGFFPSARQISENEFYPANLMGIIGHCFVIKSGASYNYSYTWANQQTSKQAIEDIYIGGLEDTSSNYSPVGWHASSSSYVGGRYFYDSTYQVSGALAPGHSLGGFGTTSLSPPSIVKYYGKDFVHTHRLPVMLNIAMIFSRTRSQAIRWAPWTQAKRLCRLIFSIL